ncbi:hypothetical protein RND81_01G060000 [Saponaria officinalis]|uniref:Uncharacterized protein n=1 Tax=Saponaria officinalis TaxID=3572 RepID=A0AAW1NGS7_SAPOF
MPPKDKQKVLIKLIESESEIEKDELVLDKLNDLEIVRFERTESENDAKLFEAIISQIIKAAADTENVSKTGKIEDIPSMSKTSKRRFFVVHVKGKFKGFSFDHLLMARKKTLYFLAVQREEVGWMQVMDSELPIKGAK